MAAAAHDPAATATAPRVKLVPLLTQKVRTWFTLAELSFQTAYVVDSRMKFNLVLAALSEETLDCVKALVEMPEVYEPDVWAQASRILHILKCTEGDIRISILPLRASVKISKYL